MGAGAAKHFQSEKAKHAATVLSTVQTYQKQNNSIKLASPSGEVNPELFKKTIHLAAAEAKRRGNNIDDSLAQLTDADMETLRHYAESNNELDDYEDDNNKEIRNRELKLMLIEEEADDVIDETTSVLSYGEDEVVDESEIEPDSNNISPSNKRNTFNGSPVAEASEDIEVVEENIEHINSNEKELNPKKSFKLFPINKSDLVEIEEKLVDSSEYYNPTPALSVSNLSSHKASQKNHYHHNNSNNRMISNGSNKSLKQFNLNDAFSQFWDGDDNHSVTSMQSSPVHLTPKQTINKSRNPNSNNNNSPSYYKDIGQRIDERNETLMGLQRQKVMSYTQNAQLEREVELLKKQLEKMEQLEKTFDNSGNSTNTFGSNSYKPPNNGLQYQSPLSIVNNSDNYNNSNSYMKRSFDNSNKKSTTSLHNKSKTSSTIYPIHEEPSDNTNNSFDMSSNTIYPNSLNGTRADDVQADIQKRNNTLNSSSSSDSESYSKNKAQLLRDKKETLNRLQKENSFNEVDSSKYKVYSYSQQPNHISPNDSNKQINNNIIDLKQPLFPQLAPSQQNSSRQTKIIPRRRKKHTGNKGNDNSENESNFDSDDSSNLSVSSSHNNNKNDRNNDWRGKIAINNDNDNSDMEANRKAIFKTLSEEKEDMKQQNYKKLAEEMSQPSPKGNVRNRRRTINDSVTTSEKNTKSSIRDSSIIVEEKVSSKDNALKVLNRRRRNSLNGESDSSQDESDSSLFSLNKDKFNRHMIKRNSNKPSSESIPEMESVNNIVVDEKIAVPPVKRTNKKISTKQRDKLTSLNNNINSESALNEDNQQQQPKSYWTPDLDNSWGEVSLLLRKPIVSEQDMLYTVAAAEAGLMYIDQMNSIAKNMNILRGALTRWLLPYDNNTRIDNQCSTPHSVVENMPEEFKGKLTERQVHYLVAGANGVRKLVRVKIADDNDLEQARKAVKAADEFFKKLYHKAIVVEITPFDLLKMSDQL